MATVKRKRGAPPGNKNALKHGFYAKSLTEAERLELEAARTIEGIDDEIALLRVKIQFLVENDPENIQLLLDATGTLARMVRIRYRLTPKEEHTLKESITKVLTDLALPLGLGIGVGKAVGG